jgi:hypothetical protein
MVGRARHEPTVEAAVAAAAEEVALVLVRTLFVRARIAGPEKRVAELALSKRFRGPRPLGSLWICDW